MTVDLSKAKPGMIAKFRCGGQAVIDKTHYKELTHSYAFWFKGLDSNENYFEDGMVHPSSHKLLDIIALEEPPFDWKDVKPGMAFRDGGNYKLYYIGKNFQRELPCFCTETGDVLTISNFKHFTRAPEHDIKETP